MSSAKALSQKYVLGLDLGSASLGWALADFGGGVYLNSESRPSLAGIR